MDEYLQEHLQPVKEAVNEILGSDRRTVLYFGMGNDVIRPLLVFDAEVIIGVSFVSEYELWTIFNILLHLEVHLVKHSFWFDSSPRSLQFEYRGKIRTLTYYSNRDYRQFIPTINETEGTLITLFLNAPVLDTSCHSWSEYWNLMSQFDQALVINNHTLDRLVWQNRVQLVLTVNPGHYIDPISIVNAHPEIRISKEKLDYYTAHSPYQEYRPFSFDLEVSGRVITYAYVYFEDIDYYIYIVL